MHGILSSSAFAFAAFYVAAYEQGNASRCIDLVWKEGIHSVSEARWERWQGGGTRTVTLDPPPLADHAEDGKGQLTRHNGTPILIVVGEPLRIVSEIDELALIGPGPRVLSPSAHRPAFSPATIINS